MPFHCCICIDPLHKELDAHPNSIAPQHDNIVFLSCGCFAHESCLNAWTDLNRKGSASCPECLISIRIPALTVYPTIGDESQMEDTTLDYNAVEQKLTQQIASLQLTQNKQQQRLSQILKRQAPAKNDDPVIKRKAPNKWDEAANPVNKTSSRVSVNIPKCTPNGCCSRVIAVPVRRSGRLANTSRVVYHRK